MLIFLFLCAGTGMLAVAIQGGPVEANLPANNVVRLGSDNFVLSNYSFQNGTTYYFDLNGNGVRNIFQFQVLSDTHRLELVIHHADRAQQQDREIISVPMP